MVLERLTGTYNAALQQAAALGSTTSASARIGGLNPRNAAQSKVEHFRTLIDQAAQRYSVDAALLSAVVEVESAGNPRAVSRAGAQGLAQLMPATARELGVQDPLDPAQNLDGAAKYLRQLLGQFKGDISKALAAYNAGAGNVQKYGGIPPFAETQAYVPAVLTAYDGYRQEPATADSTASTTPLVAAASGPPDPVAASDSRVPWILELAALRLQGPRPIGDSPPAV